MRTVTFDHAYQWLYFSGWHELELTDCIEASEVNKKNNNMNLASFLCLVIVTGFFVFNTVFAEGR